MDEEYKFVYKEIGNYIRKKRKKLKITQKNFLNKSEKYIREIEKGKREISIDELITICRKLKCNSIDILNTLIEIDSQSNKNINQETYIDIKQLTVVQFLKRCITMNCMPEELLNKEFNENERNHLSTLEKGKKERIYTLIGRNISSKRKKQLKLSKEKKLSNVSYTQEGLSSYLYRNTKYINNIENGKVENISVLELIDICNALSCTPNNILEQWILKK